MARRNKRFRGIRNAAYGLATVAIVLVLSNTAVEGLESWGCLDTYRGPDDFVQTVDERLFEEDGSGYWATTAYARRSMVPGRFRTEKGGGWRAFVLGGSFAMGDPFVHPRYGEERPGGMVSRIRARLRAAAPGRTVEVVNAAAAGQNSHRVRRIAEQVVAHAPDVLIVATCNNEGSARPSAMRERLRQFGGFRLLSRLLSGAPDPSERSYYTPQFADVQTVRREFRENIEAIVTAAGERGIPVVLATLPVNLRYEDNTPGHPLPDDPGGGKPPPEETVAPCVERAKAAYRVGDHAAAEDALGDCDDLEVLRWRGLVRMAVGDAASARLLLEQYVELFPRNRCRPSFNAVLRKIAAARAHVHLVDLAARAEALSPQGLPGGELFVDYCHMNRAGYTAMADEILRVLEKEGLAP